MKTEIEKIKCPKCNTDNLIACLGIDLKLKIAKYFCDSCGHFFVKKDNLKYGR